MTQIASQLDMAGLLALAAALGWASGFRLYLVVFVVGLAGALDLMALPEGLKLLQHPALLAASGPMLFLEFFADKIPGVDTLWDLFNILIRVPGGALLAASVFGADNASMAALAALLGGTLAASSQAAKTSTRAAINSSPEPFSNIAASLVEDGLALGALWLAVTHPLLFALVLALVVALLAWLTLLMFRFLRMALRRLSRWFAGQEKGALNV
jgi:hypothetical protein